MNIFNSIPLLRPKRNVFNLGYENRISTDLFRLTPFFFKEALPDDVFKMRAEVFARVMPAFNAPLMQRFNIRTYFFFVPTRIIWDEFEKFINPKSGSSEIVSPRLKIKADVVNSNYIDCVGPKSLADYLGLNFGLDPEDQASSEAFIAGVQKIFTDSDSLVHDIEISALPFRAYQQVYNDWFIDLNNVDISDFSKASGVEELKLADFQPGDEPYNAELYQKLMKIRHRAWEHDYFTSALPHPQRGDDVMAFDGGISEVTIEGKDNTYIAPTAYHRDGVTVNVKQFALPDGSSVANVGDLVSHYADFGFASEAAFLSKNNIVADAGVPGGYKFSASDTSGNGHEPGHVFTDNKGALKYFIFGYTTEGGGAYRPLALPLGVASDPADVSGSSTPLFMVSGADVASVLKASASGTSQGVTVEELRIRMQMQSFLERNNVAGPRYTEMLYAHWGVKDPDGRLQRSEFLGGSVQPLMINEVTQTSAPTDEDPLGQYAGQGTSSNISRPIKFRVPEHGFIIGLLAIMPRTGYFQGIEPYWTRFDRLDYFWPSFAHLGEQEIKNREVMFSCFEPDGIFGYQQRYAEYKSSYDQVHGDMKGSLAFWHGARAFASPESEDDIPKLSGEFTTPSYSGQDGIDRIFPVLSSEVPIYNADHFVCDVYNHCVASRRMPKFVTPRNGS